MAERIVEERIKAGFVEISMEYGSIMAGKQGQGC